MPPNSGWLSIYSRCSLPEALAGASRGAARRAQPLLTLPPASSYHHAESARQWQPGYGRAHGARAGGEDGRIAGALAGGLATLRSIPELLYASNHTTLL